jgi:hypothetical protein
VDELLSLGFTAREAMCWIRICSPGTMLGPQHSVSCASSLESASLSVISRASLVESFCSRADTLCGAEPVELDIQLQQGCNRATDDTLCGAEPVEHAAHLCLLESEAFARDTFLIAQSDLVVSYDDKLGQGTTGTVYRGIVRNQVELAVKVMNANMTGAEQQQALADLRQVCLANASPRHPSSSSCPFWPAREILVNTLSCPRVYTLVLTIQLLSSHLTLICCQEIVVGKIMPSHPNLPVFVGFCETLSMGPMVMWKLVDGHNLHELICGSSQCKGKPPWKPKVRHVLAWSQQLFSALACLHSHGTLTIFHVSTQFPAIIMDIDRYAL